MENIIFCWGDEREKRGFILEQSYAIAIPIAIFPFMHAPWRGNR